MIHTVTYQKPSYSLKEILRYAGSSSEDKTAIALAEECIKEIGETLTFKVCYIKTDVKICGDTVDLSVINVRSRSLAKNLEGCRSAIIFGATVGVEMDRLIARYAKISPARAVIMQAIGTERIESLCDMFQQEIQQRYKHISPRFGIGYGDLDLSVQKEIFEILDCNRKIGLTLNSSMLMSPAKSVTAVIGI